MGEGTSLDILTGESNVVALLDKGSESESLSGTPVDALTLSNGLLSGLEDLGDGVVEFLVFW